MSYDNDNKGAVWPNEDRQESTHPHWKGQATIAGVEYWVSAWKKASDASEKAPSIRFTFKAKEARGDKQGRSRPADVPNTFDDDSIPF